MSFNWRSAGAGLLGEVGRQAENKATEMSRLEERRLEEQIANRKEEAKLLREQSLKTLGYTKDGVPITKGEYDQADTKPLLYEKGLDREKPLGYTKDGVPITKEEYDQADTKPLLYEKGLDREKPLERGTTREEYDALVYIYGVERAKQIMDENRSAKNSTGSRTGALPDDKKIEIIRERKGEYLEAKKQYEEDNAPSLFSKKKEVAPFPDYHGWYQEIEPDEYSIVYGGSGQGMSGSGQGLSTGRQEMSTPGQQVNADSIIDDILAGKKVGTGMKDDSANAGKPKLAVTGLLAKGAEMVGVGPEDVKKSVADMANSIATGSFGPSDVINAGEKGLAAAKEAAQWAGEKQGVANETILEVNRLIGEGTVESVSKALSWIKDIMTAETDQKELKGSRFKE